MKKILFVCPFPYGLQAGQRLKFEQHYNLFKKNGYAVNYESFIDNNTYKYLYKKGYFVLKLFSLIKGYIRRLLLIKQLRKYDIIYVFMWVTPYFGNLFEKIYLKNANKIIFDMEDNVLLSSNNLINKLGDYFKNKNKIYYLINNSDHIITSTPALGKITNEINKKNNWTYICASIEVDRYNKSLLNNSKITIGWTGTFSSMNYLKKIENVIEKISRIRDIEFIIISNSYYKIPNVKCRYINWNKQTEINDLSYIDIGLYPLPLNNDWVIGKSGLKALQYMAMSIPAVCTDVGNIRNIIENEIDGFLVKSNKEWFDVLIKLIDNKSLRENIGRMARKKVVKDFSVNAINNKYLTVFENLIK